MMKSTRRRTQYSPVRQMSSDCGGAGGGIAGNSGGGSSRSFNELQYQRQQMNQSRKTPTRNEEEDSSSAIELRGTNLQQSYQSNNLFNNQRKSQPQRQQLQYIDDSPPSPPLTLEEYERQQQESNQNLDLNLNFNNQEHEQQSQTSEEVYVYSCCGLTRELVPSIKYMSTFRNLFFAFNFLVFIFGLGNLGMGLWFRIDPKVYEIHKFIETQNFTIAGWIMLFGGFATLLISLVGFNAAAKQSAGLLVFYFISMILLTLASVGSIVLLTVYGLGHPLERFLTKEIYEQMRRTTMNNNLDPSVNYDAIQFMDFIQVKMRCCGAADFTDYTKLGLPGPPTTCYTIGSNFLNAPGCGRAIRELFDLRAGLATGFSAASVLSQLLTTILSAMMFCSLYHYRANPRPASPAVMANLSARNTPTLYQQGPRSRTPIVI